VADSYQGDADARAGNGYGGANVGIALLNANDDNTALATATDAGAKASAGNGDYAINTGNFADSDAIFGYASSAAGNGSQNRDCLLQNANDDNTALASANGGSAHAAAGNGGGAVECGAPSGVPGANQPAAPPLLTGDPAANTDNFAYAASTNSASHADAAAGNGDGGLNTFNSATALASAGGHAHAAAGNGSGAPNAGNTANAASVAAGANAEAGNGDNNIFNYASAEGVAGGYASATSSGTDNLAYSVEAGHAYASSDSNGVNSTTKADADTVGGTALAVATSSIPLTSGGTWSVSLNFNGTEDTVSG
jgi:hypothetical protein